MLFHKKHPRSCSYCRHCTKINDAQMLCAKRGIVSTEHSCIKFKYDPCKRIPPKQKTLDFVKYDEEDFSL